MISWEPSCLALCGHCLLRIVPYSSSLHPITESLIHPHQTPSTSCSLMSLCTWQGGIFDLRSSLCPLPREERREALHIFLVIEKHFAQCRLLLETWIKISLRDVDQDQNKTPRPRTKAVHTRMLCSQTNLAANRRKQLIDP